MPEPRARLFCPTGPAAGSEYPLAEAATLGSDPANQIVVSSGRVLPRHAQIGFDPEAGRYYLEPAARRAVIEVDGVVARGRVPLGDLNVITVGGQDFLFVRGRTPTAPAAMTSDGTTITRPETVQVPDFSSRPPEPQPPPDAGGTLLESGGRIAVPSFGGPDVQVPAESPSPPSRPGGQPVLLAKLPDGPLEFPLAERSYWVGRSPESDIRLADPSVSRRHARLEWCEGRLTLEDADSVNYTFVDDQRVRNRVDVEPGSTLRFGSLEARIVWRATDE